MVASQRRSWSHLVVLGAIFGHLSPNIDKVSQKLTFEYPHEGPCVGPALANRLLRQPRKIGLTL